MKGVDRLVGDARERHPRSMDSRERTVVWALSIAYAGTASAVAFVVPWNRHPSVWVVAGLVILCAAVSAITFEVGSVTAVATPLGLVPLLFVAPLPLLPVIVPLSYFLATLTEFITRRKHIDRSIYAVCDSWIVLGPVLVIGLMASGPPKLAFWDVYLLAFAAQFVSDVGPTMVRERLARAVTARETLLQGIAGYRIDACLWPVAVVVSIAAYDEPLALLGLIPLLWLLHTFSHERRERYDAALELNRAYRGTVMLLSDVVEADDNYTADHCRGVVTLVSAVADELEIEPEARQELEFAALLHDVGKIVIPKEIINKPGALSDDEFELMKTHTIEGQVLLDRVGGLLGRVGSLVRSCHERWDGNGYPDGLAGYEIPLAARIVFACDAYSAMTTDRPYRAAMSQETALEELWANAGTQFDPRVVSALASVIRNGSHVESSPALDVRQVLARNAAIIGGPRAQLSLSARPAPPQ
ncbi:MAG TPA: HD-GYP domain-containing protein [Thermoleophilaceae bacterium]|jgi:HD-GYP domain-containing protein (c-di-GMP phosphodiesterase class II)